MLTAVAIYLTLAPLAAVVIALLVATHRDEPPPQPQPPRR